jgi:hypothetical protein
MTLMIPQTKLPAPSGLPADPCAGALEGPGRLDGGPAGFESTSCAGLRAGLSASAEGAWRTIPSRLTVARETTGRFHITLKSVTIALPTECADDGLCIRDSPIRDLTEPASL